MSQLTRRIVDAVEQGRFLIGYHANQRLRQREIPVWQVVDGTREGRILRERPGDSPNPVIEVEQLLSGGKPYKAVWAWIEETESAKLVTVHFFDYPPGY